MYCMELRHLRYFLAVAEERHFTRAAARLGLSQPPLSLQIRQLEEKIGAPLFRRLARGVELTEAGQALVPHAQAILDAAGKSGGIARRAARGETGELRLGLSGSTPYHPAVPELIRAFRVGYPGVEISIRETHSSELVRAIGESALDVALVLEPLDHGENSSTGPCTAPLIAVLPQDHAARRSTVALKRFAEESFILVPRSIGPGWRPRDGRCRTAGFSRMSAGMLAHHFGDPFVAAGLGVPSFRMAGDDALGRNRLSAARRTVAAGKDRIGPSPRCPFRAHPQLRRSGAARGIAEDRLRGSRIAMTSAPNSASPMRFEGKIAIVTGAAHGIGLACAERLAGDGASVAIVDIDEPAGRAAAERLSQRGEARFVRCDVGDSAGRPRPRR